MTTEDILFWMDIEDKLVSYGVPVEVCRDITKSILERGEQDQWKKIDDAYMNKIDKIDSLLGDIEGTVGDIRDILWK